jgi:2-polyprenyl-3-methyl-5-hydroxy-6-metoxy-1,4-benzoquinol methylase
MRRSSKSVVANRMSKVAARIRKEAEENDTIYGRRSLEVLDLSRMHYGHIRMLEWALQNFPNLKVSRVLDIGIGEGQSSALLARAGAHVTGIDVSGKGLERAQELARRCGVKIDFKQMAGEELRFEDASFDAVLCVSAYHHMDLEKATREIARVLRPGGRVVLIEPLATNPLAWIYRQFGRILAREATSEEMPLRFRDLRLLRQHFHNVKWQGMFFLSVGLFGLERVWNNEIPLLKAFTRSMSGWVFPLDTLLLKIPGLQSIAWKIGIVADR